MKMKIRSWFKNHNVESDPEKKYDNIDLNLLLLEEFGMKITYPIDRIFNVGEVILTGEGRQLIVYPNCIYYANTEVDNNIPVTNDIFILADIIREKYDIKPTYNIFTDAKIDGGI